MKEYERAQIEIVEIEDEDIVTVSGDPKNGSPVRSLTGVIYGGRDVSDQFWLPWIN